MQIIMSMLIFCIVLFLYLHIYFHLKTSDDLEIYEIDRPSKDKLEEICDLRQPVRFDFVSEGLLDTCKRQNVVDTYGAFDVKIRDVQRPVLDDEELYVPLPFNGALKVVTDDKTSRYVVENNQDFLEETGMIKAFRYNDAFIRPYMVAACDYDYIIGSPGARTPFRYEVNYRNYFFVAEGSVKIKLAPPRSTKYLYQKKDYDNFEFRSPVNPWDVQQQYKPDFDKIKCLEVVLPKGHMLFIPAFWWYSMEFAEHTSVASFKYRTYMNTVAILPQLFLRFLQQQNVKRDIVPKLDASELKSSGSVNVETAAENEKSDSTGDEREHAKSE